MLVLDDIPKSVPDVPVLNVCAVAVNPFKDEMPFANVVVTLDMFPFSVYKVTVFPFALATCNCTTILSVRDNVVPFGIDTAN
jgi:hypothetical protein